MTERSPDAMNKKDPTWCRKVLVVWRTTEATLYVFIPVTMRLSRYNKKNFVINTIPSTTMGRF